MRNQETGLDYCDVDLQEVRIHQSYHRHKRDWKDEYLELVTRRDYDAAHELRLKNDDRYAEQCEAEAVSVFPAVAPQIPLHQPIAEDDDEDREAA